MERHKLKIAVYTLLIKDNKVCLTRRLNTGWQDGNYTLPAGHLEKDESLVEAAIRETKEEVGVTVKPEDIKYIHTMHRFNLYMDIFFIATKWGGEPYNAEPDKCDDVSWFSLDKLPENMVPSVRHVISQYQKGIFFSEFDPSVER